MVTLTTDYGSFEADTEDECIALARKAKREHAKAVKARAERLDKAYEAATRRGFAIYDAVYEALRRGRKLSRAWCLADPLVKYTGVTVTTREFGGGHAAKYHGTADVDHYGYRIVDVILDGSGWCIGLIVRPWHATDDGGDEILAVGVHEDTAAFKSLEIDASDLRAVMAEPRVEREPAAAE